MFYFNNGKDTIYINIKALKGTFVQFRLEVILSCTYAHKLMILCIVHYAQIILRQVHYAQMIFG